MADFDRNGTRDLAVPFSDGDVVRVYLNRTPKPLEDLDGNQILDVCEVDGEGRPFLRGDVDASGKRNITDPVVLLRWQFVGDFDVRCPKAADANDDGLTDVSDAVALLEFLFLNSDPLPPQRDCGQDPTPDALGCEEFAACPSAEG